VVRSPDQSYATIALERSSKDMLCQIRKNLREERLDSIGERCTLDKHGTASCEAVPGVLYVDGVEQTPCGYRAPRTSLPPYRPIGEDCSFRLWAALISPLNLRKILATRSTCSFLLSGLDTPATEANCVFMGQWELFGRRGY
jgi:hypothetical protein